MLLFLVCWELYEWMMNIVKWFLHPLKTYSVNILNCIFWFSGVNSAWILRIKHTWSSYIILFSAGFYLIICEICQNYIFTYDHEKYRPIIFFFGIVLGRFWIRVILATYNRVKSVTPTFSKRIFKIFLLFFLKCLLVFTNKIIWPWRFFQVFNYVFNLIVVEFGIGQLLKVVSSFYSFCSFKKVWFYLNYWIISHNVVYNILLLFLISLVSLMVKLWICKLSILFIDFVSAIFAFYCFPSTYFGFNCFSFSFLKVERSFLESDFKSFSFSYVTIKRYIFLTNAEGNGNPLQYSCLENPMDRGARLNIQILVWILYNDITSFVTISYRVIFTVLKILYALLFVSAQSHSWQLVFML